MLTRGKSHLELLDEARHVLVANDGALPFLNAHDRLVDLDLEVAFDLGLASETPMLLDLLASEVGTL